MQINADDMHEVVTVCDDYTRTALETLMYAN